MLNVLNVKGIHVRRFYAEEQSDGSWLHNDGDVYWYNEIGEIHREDGPAAICPLGINWCLSGEEYKFDEWLKLTPISDEEKMLLRLQYA
jgi:hypothetical protein|tara:strand:- start:223 stop:489 length:267 start_codon:yes stop_codon:yes gene_type:complete